VRSFDPSQCPDENGVVVFFEDFGLAAYTPEGKDRWTAPLGPFRDFYGMASSPILAEGLVVLLCDQKTGSFLLALDGRTGEVRWRTERPGMDIGWATPMVFRPAVSAPAELIVLGSSRLDSYSLASGESKWWAPPASEGAMGTAVSQGDTSTGAIGQYYASPVAAEGKIFLASVSGRISVVRAGASSWDVLAVNDLEEAIRATPALSRGRIYVRADKALYCSGTERGEAHPTDDESPEHLVRSFRMVGDRQGQE